MKKNLIREPLPLSSWESVLAEARRCLQLGSGISTRRSGPGVIDYGGHLVSLGASPSSGRTGRTLIQMIALSDTYGFQHPFAHFTKIDGLRGVDLWVRAYRIDDTSPLGRLLDVQSEYVTEIERLEPLLDPMFHPHRAEQIAAELISDLGWALTRLRGPLSQGVRWDDAHAINPSFFLSATSTFRTELDTLRRIQRAYFPTITLPAPPPQLSASVDRREAHQYLKTVLAPTKIELDRSLGSMQAILQASPHENHVLESIQRRTSESRALQRGRRLDWSLSVSAQDLGGLGVNERFTPEGRRIEWRDPFVDTVFPQRLVQSEANDMPVQLDVTEEDAFVLG